MTVEEVRARGALRALVDAYATAADRRDEAGFLDLFLPDATLTVVQGDAEILRCTGRDELPSAIAPLAQYVATMHLMANHSVAFEGERARGTVYCLANHVRPAADGVENLLMAINYGDEYVHGTGGWRFASREVRILWTEVRPASVEPLAL
jgi:uncharacterized protein (TIGR02246 family)